MFVIESFDSHDSRIVCNFSVCLPSSRAVYPFFSVQLVDPTFSSELCEMITLFLSSCAMLASRKHLSDEMSDERRSEKSLILRNNFAPKR